MNAEIGPADSLPSGDDTRFDKNVAAMPDPTHPATISAETTAYTPLRLSSGYGMRMDPLTHVPTMHRGIDMPSSLGRSVVASADGIVTQAGMHGGYGELIEIDHGCGLRSRYAHLQAVLVSVGSFVRRGALIGRVGSTGRSTGPHLHFEVRLHGASVDPLWFLGEPSDMGSILAMRPCGALVPPRRYAMAGLRSSVRSGH